MVAGHVTVTRAIGSALNRSLLLPASARRTCSTPSRRRSAIEEILRLESPAQGLVPHRHARRRDRRHRHSGRRAHHGAFRLGQSRRVRVRGGRDVRSRSGRPRAAYCFRQGHPFLHRGAAGAARAWHRAAGAAHAPAGAARRAAEPRVREPAFFARGFAELHVAWGRGSRCRS